MKHRKESHIAERIKAQKEQIMKDAIKATVHPEDYELWCDLSQTNLQDGQEVKVIVIKED